MCARDDWNNTVPGAVIIASHNNSDLYASALEKIQAAIGPNPDGTMFGPHVMMDQDDVIADSVDK